MILVNGKFEVQWEQGMTVSELLRQLKFSFPLIIVSVDGMLVPKEEYSTRHIPDSSDVKVLHMTAGG
jgi:thiamine biosynthesis protein ThiS